ncbi:efflux RND transporter periplasmic adaptor subunit [Flavihumibacter sp. R14]|nr:efflux RND transporter periplasmic adaptor subunit [Flavihumibacter soli]
MKRILSIAAVVFLASCAGKSTDKKSELETLKKERTELNSRIAKLEAEIGTSAAPSSFKEVSVFEVSESPFRNYVEVQGKVDAEENVQVTPETPGVVTAVYVNIGQRVSRGQVLAQLDDKVLGQNMAELQTQLQLANTLYQRQKNLWEQKIGSEVQYLNAKTVKESAERRIATLNSQAAMYKIKAPISGTIDEMDLRVGQAVSPGASGIRIINASNLKVKAQVAESYAARVNQSDDVSIIFPDVPDTLETKLSFASKTIDPISRSFNVEVKLPSKKTYRPNMLAVVKIVDYKNDKALIVPVNSIQKAESGDYVFVAENGKAKRVSIQAGKVSEGKAEVLSGLKSGDKVITAGIQDLNEGDIVKF